MQAVRIGQAVILMMIVALAASCAASKEYSSKLFAPRTPSLKDTQVLALRFLDLDDLEINKDGWVKTDIVNGKDSSSQTLALDKLARTIPSSEKQKPVATKEEKKITAESGPVARTVTNPDGSRSKQTRE